MWLSGAGVGFLQSCNDWILLYTMSNTKEEEGRERERERVKDVWVVLLLLLRDSTRFLVQAHLWGREKAKKHGAFFFFFKVVWYCSERKGSVR